MSTLNFKPRIVVSNTTNAVKMRESGGVIQKHKQIFQADTDFTLSDRRHACTDAVEHRNQPANRRKTEVFLSLSGS